jgi:hypothetical protein
MWASLGGAPFYWSLGAANTTNTRETRGFTGVTAAVRLYISRTQGRTPAELCNNRDMAIDNSSHPSTRAPEPSHDELFEDVAEVRSRGVGNEEKPLVDLAALLWAARNASPEGQNEEEIDDADKIEYTLRLAVSRLGGKSAQAIEALLGLSKQTRGRTIGFRRGEAVKLYGKSRETFRVRFETPLLMAVATYLRVLVDERRLADVRAELRALLTKNQDLPTPSLLNLDDDWETDGPGYPFRPLLTDEVLRMVKKPQR